MTRDFIRYFEEHFLFSQRDKGMHVLGQFEAVDDPNRFVWIRGFEDMAARLRGLSDFYGGPFWQARRSEVNAMIVDLDDAPCGRLGPSLMLAGGLSLEDRASAPPGAVPPHTGLVAVDFHRAEPEALARLVELFEQRVRPALLEQGHHVLGHFVAERAPNDYPRLPVRQDPTLLLVLSAYRDAEHLAAMRTGWPGGDPWRSVLDRESRAPLGRGGDVTASADGSVAHPLHSGANRLMEGHAPCARHQACAHGGRRKMTGKGLGAPRSSGLDAPRSAVTGLSRSGLAGRRLSSRGGARGPREPTRSADMKYLLLNYVDEAAIRSLPREEAGRMHAAYMAYTEAMKKAGVLLDNHGLRSTAEATTVRAPGGKQSVVNGPFAETKEQLGGYFLIDVPDLDAALSWAARCPAVQHGAIEVRPVWG